MKIHKNSPAYLQKFFTERLGMQMKASPNTVASYRDTFRLLLRYASEQRKKEPTALQIADIDADLVARLPRPILKKHAATARAAGTRASRPFARSSSTSPSTSRSCCFIASAFSPCRRNDT